MKINFLFWAAVLGGLAVLLGALGAHALETRLSPARLDAFNTAVEYQFYHALALGIIHSIDPASSIRRLRQAGYLFLAGTGCFCGSLYMLSLQDLAGFRAGFLGPVTPLGGLLFMAGWLMLALRALNRRSDS